MEDRSGFRSRLRDLIWVFSVRLPLLFWWSFSEALTLSPSNGFFLHLPRLSLLWLFLHYAIVLHYHFCAPSDAKVHHLSQRCHWFRYPKNQETSLALVSLFWHLETFQQPKDRDKIFSGHKGLLLVVSLKNKKMRGSQILAKWGQKERPVWVSIYLFSCIRCDYIKHSYVFFFFFLLFACWMDRWKMQILLQ